jgi:HEAT repeat protein
VTAAAGLAIALGATGLLVLLLVTGTVARRVARRARTARVARRAQPLRPLLVLLVAGEPEESAGAAARLAALDEASWRAVEPGVAALLGKVRGDAHEEVARLLDERGVLDRARRDLRRRSAVRRCTAAELLGRAQVTSAARGLLRLLDDPAPEVRQVAARALGRIGDPVAAAPLLAALAARPPRVPATVVAQALLRVGLPAAPALVEAVAHPVPVVRTTAVEVLGRLGAVSALAALTERLEHDELAEVRARAATALGALGLPAAAGALVTATGPDSAPAVRAAATRALGELGVPQGADALCALIDDDDERVAAGAGTALLGLGERGRDVLQRVAADTRGGLLRGPEQAREVLALASVGAAGPGGAA